MTIYSNNDFFKLDFFFSILIDFYKDIKKINNIIIFINFLVYFIIKLKYYGLKD